MNESENKGQFVSGNDVSVNQDGSKCDFVVGSEMTWWVGKAPSVERVSFYSRTVGDKGPTTEGMLLTPEQARSMAVLLLNAADDISYGCGSERSSNIPVAVVSRSGVRSGVGKALSQGPGSTTTCESYTDFEIWGTRDAIARLHKESVNGDLALAIECAIEHGVGRLRRTRCADDKFDAKAFYTIHIVRGHDR